MTKQITNRRDQFTRKDSKTLSADRSGSGIETVEKTVIACGVDFAPEKTGGKANRGSRREYPFFCARFFIEHVERAIDAAPEIDQPARDNWLGGSVESHPVRPRPRRAHRIGWLMCPEEKRIFDNRFRCVATSRRIAAKGRLVLTLAHLIGENANSNRMVTILMKTGFANVRASQSTLLRFNTPACSYLRTGLGRCSLFQ